MPDKPLQEHLFQRIRERLPVGVQLVDAVADVLHLSYDSTYRRIRGETPLVLDEVLCLCQHYGLSLDGLLQTKANTITFESVQVNNGTLGFEAYLQGLLQGLNQVAQAGTKEVIYLTKDFPIFHLFNYRPLFSFRYFFWMKSILQHPDFATKKFTLDCLPPHIEQTGKQILQAYNGIPSTEIWNTECINSTIAQIEYYREAGFFARPEDDKIVYDALHQTVEHIKAEAETGCKFLPGENPQFKKEVFQFYHNRVVLGDNTILVLHDGAKTLYLNYDTLNYLVTHDEHFCNDVHERLQNLMRRATILSRVSEKQRHLFFNALLKKIPISKQSLVP